MSSPARSHDFHRACVQSYAEHAILSDSRWRVRCAQQGCAYQLYTSDVRELCGASSPAFIRCAAPSAMHHGACVRLPRATCVAPAADCFSFDWWRLTASVSSSCRISRSACAKCRLARMWTPRRAAGWRRTATCVPAVRRANTGVAWATVVTQLTSAARSSSPGHRLQGRWLSEHHMHV
jgi:hypothetical protein